MARFTKGHGLGNDYLVMDERDIDFPLGPAAVRWICHRNWGVGSDGMAIDCAGNLYITQGGVRVFSPGGQEIGRIQAPGAANVAFGGPERRTLYITATTQLLALELAIPGLPY